MNRQSIDTRRESRTRLCFYLWQIRFVGRLALSTKTFFSAPALSEAQSLNKIRSDGADKSRGHAQSFNAMLNLYKLLINSQRRAGEKEEERSFCVEVNNEYREAFIGKFWDFQTGKSFNAKNF